MRRIVINLNAGWLFTPHDHPAAAGEDCEESAFVPVTLPHASVELPYHNFSEQDYAFVSWYRRRFALPEDAAGRRVFLDFEGVAPAATVYVNGRPAAPECRVGFAPFSFDVTDLVKPGGGNLLSVRVDSTGRPDAPRSGGESDVLIFGGIHGDVELRVVDPVYLKDIFVVPRNVLSDRKSVDITATVVNTTAEELEVDLTAGVGGGPGAAGISGDLELPARGEAKITFGIPGLEAQLWGPDHPTLYEAAVELEGGDRLATRFGFRTLEFGRGEFRLNGTPIRLRGLSRRPTFPYVGPAAPARLQVRDALILKQDLACNVVRTSDYPPSRHFLDACDELGLLVIEDLPARRHAGDEGWERLALRDVGATIRRDRNRPSVILWDMSPDVPDDDPGFLARTEELARRLDPTRPTEGNRFIPRESCGPAFPTRSLDGGHRSREHALYHAQVHDRTPGTDLAGCIGRCAFDYNTRAAPGSGDRVCHDGVMDIFREPRPAAHFYAAFADPAERVVLEPAPYWESDESGGGDGPLVVFGNVEEIEVFIGDVSAGRHGPRRDRYPHLARPPFVVDLPGGVRAGRRHALTVAGFIGGQAVVTRKIAADGVPARLVVEADDEELDADGADMTRVALRIRDESGNVLPFAAQPVSLRLQGPGVLVGDNPFPMPGGRGAVYVRAAREPGTITLTATTPGLPAQCVTLQCVTVQGVTVQGVTVQGVTVRTVAVEG